MITLQCAIHAGLQYH